ncbi:MAG: hypothetical protein ABSD87_05105 [Candidatus Acidiferrales bacterium]|jgi:hypothetical protein
MHALNRFAIAVVSAGIFVGAAAAQVQTQAQTQNQTANRAPQQTATVNTADQAIDLIIAREHDEISVIRQYNPIVETYVQDMKPDAEMGIVPVKDHYFLGQADWSKGISDDSMLEKKKSKVSGFNPFSHLEGSSSAVPHGFMQMIFIDVEHFDRQHYQFTYVGREFLGEVRCAIFDVVPLPKAGRDSFYGRIWAEDQGFTIVRFNGMFASSANEGTGNNLHFDSWRMNLQPHVWLPAFVYSQESELKSSSASSIRFKAQTRLWGYNLASLNRPLDFNQGVTPDNGKGAEDYSPVQAEREWQERAEAGVVDRLQRIGLLAPRGEVDKTLETVVNNLEVTNNLDIDVHCRVMLTSTLETFSIGHTIVISRGLLDVLPDEASLAAVLAKELASIMITKPSTDQWGFSDTTLVTAGEALSRFSFKATAADVDLSNRKAVELLKNSPYKDKLGNASLFLKQLSAASAALPALIDARLGNGVALSSDLANLGPALQTGKLDQVAALPLGARVKVNPWDDRVELLRAKPVPLNSAREKMPFEVTPFRPFLMHYQAPNAAPADAATPNPSGKTSASATNMDAQQ